MNMDKIEKETGELTVYNVKKDVKKKERYLSEIDGYYGVHSPFRPPPKIIEYWLDLWSTSEALGLSGVYDTVLLDKFVISEYEIDEIITIKNGKSIFYYNSYSNKIYFPLSNDKWNPHLDEKTIKILVEYMGCQTYAISFERQVTPEQPFLVCINGVYISTYNENH